jgi:hypothetical protein
MRASHPTLHLTEAGRRRSAQGRDRGARIDNAVQRPRPMQIPSAVAPVGLQGVAAHAERARAQRSMWQ